MNKNAIKKYAVWARRELISRVSQRAALYDITEKNPGDPTADCVHGQVLTASEKKERQALIAQIRIKGYEEVMEEAAYTWFNRFSALRFMEVNGYLPTHVRVFTDDDNAFKPQILTEAINLELDGLDMEKVYALKNDNKTDELFKYLVIVQCNALSSILPGMFQQIEDYTELLFPDNLLRAGSAIEQMIALIPEEDWQDQVQIIGWLYQYYNSEKKDDVFAALKKNIKITKENIPAATQLFTPDWIVRYMVENSLGRLWVEGHPNEELKSHWKYYLEEAEQEPEVQVKLAEIRKGYAQLNPEDIKVVDPCCGSGHILAYMFDVLVQIYEANGYMTRDAVRSIVDNNIYGLDIDERAAQLAYFSVMMKGRQYDSRFFKRGLQPHVYAIEESNNVDKYALEYFCNSDAKLTQAMDTIVKELHDAKEYGSILTVTPQDWTCLYERFEAIKDDNSLYRESALAMLPMVHVAEALAQKYEVVVTNPPYMGASNMNAKLNDFIKNNYTDYKSDFFSAFVIHASQITKKDGYCGFLTPYVWMFIQSYDKMRSYLYRHATIETLIQFEYSAFEEATVPICTFAFRKGQTAKKGCYLRLTDFRGGMEVQRQKALEAISNHDCGFYYEQSTDNFKKIPGSPVAYWVSEQFINSFTNGTLLSEFAEPRAGLATGNNELFERFWYEVSYAKIGFGFTSVKDTINAPFKWYPCNSGGEFRKWSFNHEIVVNWENDGFEIKHLINKNGKLAARPQNTNYYFKCGLTWNKLSSSRFAVKFKDTGSIFDDTSRSLFIENNDILLYLLGFMCSCVTFNYFKALNPSMSFTNSDIERLPFVMDCAAKLQVDGIVHNNLILSQADWDSFETSWDFKYHPLICGAVTVFEAFALWDKECDLRFNQLKANEEELNRIFIDIYGLQDELTPEVDDKDVTVRKADLQRDIRSLISYAVGCMFGRYSLNKEGLAYAGGNWDPTASSLMPTASFPPDQDNIIPICDDEYFEDDIVNRFVKFIEVVYGEDTLEENLKFIADALGGKGHPREVIRNYFLKDFYADHLKIYQKRPIYWLFDSGKKNGFKCLIYMHRYQPDTIARIRTDYVHEQQSRYSTAMADLENRLDGAVTRERVKINKQLEKLREQAEEARLYEEKIHHLADQMIKIDLDDGVKVNYAKFQDVLAKIK